MDGVRRRDRHHTGRVITALRAPAVLCCCCAPLHAEAREPARCDSASASTYQEVTVAGTQPQDCGWRPAANATVDLGSEPTRQEATFDEGADVGAAAHRAPRAANEARPLGNDSGWLKLGSPPDESGQNTSGDAATTPEGANSTPGPGAWLLPGSGEIPRILGSLAVVLGAIGICTMLLRRFSGVRVRAARPAGVIEVLARYPLGRGHHLLLLKMDRRVLLLHQSGGSMTALSEVTDHREVASLLARVEAGAHESFAQKLQKALRRSPCEEENPFRRYVETVDLTRTQGGGLRALQKLRERGA